MSTAKVNLEIKNDPNTEGQILVKIFSHSNQNSNNVNIDSTLKMNENMISSIDYNNLNETIAEFEQFLNITYINEIKKSFQNSGNNNLSSNNNNNNMNINNYNNQGYNPSSNYSGFQGGEVDPNYNLQTNIYNNQNFGNFPNPYLSTGGGSVGGNLVGPNSDIFTGGNQFPHPNQGTKPAVKYDPIGPFGTFGGPDPDLANFSSTDPFQNPFGGNKFPGNKGPFGGGNGGNNPFGGNHFG